MTQKISEVIPDTTAAVKSLSMLPGVLEGAESAHPEGESGVVVQQRDLLDARCRDGAHERPSPHGVQGGPMSDTRSKTLIGSEYASSRSQMWWAAISIAVVAIVIATTGILYLKPPGNQTFHLQLSESGNLRAGDTVRVAGIPVGKVLGLTLEDDHVDVEFTVKNDVFVGGIRRR